MFQLFLLPKHLDVSKQKVVVFDGLVNGLFLNKSFGLASTCRPRSYETIRHNKKLMKPSKIFQISRQNNSNMKKDTQRLLALLR